MKRKKYRERQLMRLGMPSLIRVRFEIWRIGLTRRRFILFYFYFFFQIYKSTLCDGRKEEEIPLKILVSSGTEKNPIFLLSFFFFFSTSSEKGDDAQHQGRETLKNFFLTMKEKRMDMGTTCVSLERRISACAA